MRLRFYSVNFCVCTEKRLAIPTNTATAARIINQFRKATRRLTNKGIPGRKYPSRTTTPETMAIIARKNVVIDSHRIPNQLQQRADHNGDDEHPA